MYEKYKFPEDTSSQWNLVRREVFQIFNAPNTNNPDKQKGVKNFLTSIMDEIKEELREDAETHVIT